MGTYKGIAVANEAIVADGWYSAPSGKIVPIADMVDAACAATVPYAPDNLDRLIKRHPLKCPVAFIGARQSEEMRRVGMSMTEQIVGARAGAPGRVMMLDGSHLFPMEKPLATAAAIEAALRNMAQA